MIKWLQVIGKTINRKQEAKTFRTPEDLGFLQLSLTATREWLQAAEAQDGSYKQRWRAAQYCPGQRSSKYDGQASKADSDNQ